MNIQLKDMKLIFIDNGDTWTKRITDMEDRLIYEETNIWFEEHRNKQTFDEWEEMTKSIPSFNIVQVERFL